MTDTVVARSARLGDTCAREIPRLLTKDEIREIFMQVAIYAGVPAGVDSFRIAREVFAELDKG